MSKRIFLKCFLTVAVAGALSLTAAHNAAASIVDQMPDVAQTRFAVADSVPAAPVLSVVPDANKNPYVSVRITVPTKDKKGNPVSQITKITLYRANQAYKTFVPEQGQTVISFDDTVPQNHKSYTYGAMATNKYGNSARANKTIYVGQQKPTKPLDVVVTPDPSNHRKGTVTWQPPVKDAGNQNLDPATLSYRVALMDMNGNKINIKENTLELSCDFEYTADGYQLFSALVYASNEGGESGVGTSANRIFLGDPIQANVHESFANGKTKEPLYTGYKAGGGVVSWAVSNDQTLADIQSSDNDNGYLAVLGVNGNIGLLQSNYIDLAKFNHPYASMHLYKAEVQGKLELQITALIDTMAYVLKTVDMQQLPMPGWNQVAVDLSQFKGKLPQLCLMVVFKEHDPIQFHVDNLRIGDSQLADIGIGNISKFDIVTLGAENKICATVSNFSSSQSKAYKVELLRNGNLAFSKQMPPLDAFGSVRVELPDVVSSVASDSIFNYRIIAVMDDDCNNANDSTESFSAIPALSVMPPVRNLVSLSSSSVSLSWEMPDLDLMPVEPSVESFESYESFSPNFGNWINIDGDGRNVGGFSINNEKLPVTGPQGFFVMDVSKYPSFTSNFLYARPGSGSKFASSLYTNDGKPADDWLISPELNGCPQVLQMYVLGYFNFKTVWEVLYSTAGRDTTDFILLAKGDYNRQWKKFSYHLPQGAKYFAIHAVHVGPGSSGPASPLLCIDDIKYIPAGKGNGSLIGYNVYCDDNLLTSAPITSTKFMAQQPLTTVNYKVTAVYDRGESMPLIIPVHGSVTSTNNDQINVETGHREITISANNRCKAEIFSMNGLKITDIQLGAGVNNISIDKGCYLLRIGSRTFKVIVR